MAIEVGTARGVGLAHPELYFDERTNETVIVLHTPGPAGEGTVELTPNLVLAFDAFVPSNLVECRIRRSHHEWPGLTDPQSRAVATALFGEAVGEYLSYTDPVLAQHEDIRPDIRSACVLAGRLASLDLARLTLSELWQLSDADEEVDTELDSVLEGVWSLERSALIARIDPWLAVAAGADLTSGLEALPYALDVLHGSDSPSVLRGLVEDLASLAGEGGYLARSAVMELLPFFGKAATDQSSASEWVDLLAKSGVVWVRDRSERSQVWERLTARAARLFRSSGEWAQGFSPVQLGNLACSFSRFRQLDWAAWAWRACAVAWDRALGAEELAGLAYWYADRYSGSSEAGSQDQTQSEGDREKVQAMEAANRGWASSYMYDELPKVAPFVAEYVLLSGAGFDGR
jgi:hypothetical protein